MKTLSYMRNETEKLKEMEKEREGGTVGDEAACEP
jgi:hypothetical protein